MKLNVGIGIALVGLGGCAGEGPSYMPLDLGMSWSYVVKSGFQRDVVTVNVKHTQAIGELGGVRLVSQMGNSTLAWGGSVLYGAEFANARFSPPIPLLATQSVPKASKSRQAEFEAGPKWTGKIESFGAIRPATGVLSQRRTTIAIGGRSVTAVETVLSLDIQGVSMEIRTWFERGRGIVKQEQHTNRKQVIELELIDSE